MGLILVLVDGMGRPTAWMTAPDTGTLLAQVAQLHVLAEQLPAHVALEKAVTARPPDLERSACLDLGMFGEQHAWLLSEARHG